MINKKTTSYTEVVNIKIIEPQWHENSFGWNIFKMDGNSH